jgi:hypothetical protein
MDKRQKEFKYLDIYIKELEQKLGWGNRYEWTNYNFKKISENILNKTGISISVSSVRRVLVLDKSYKSRFNPQLETKNALVKYLGYENWADFKEKKKKEKINFPVSFKKFFGIFSITLLLLVIAIGLFFIISNWGEKNRIVYFSGKHLKGYAPHTVAIHYDLTHSKGNKHYIDFGEAYNSLSKTFLSKEEHIITHTYYNSYYYKIKLFNKNKLIATENVLVKSTGWDAGIIMENKDYILVSDHDLSTSGYLSIPDTNLIKYGIDTSGAFRTEYKIVDDFPVSLNNSSIALKIRSKLIDGGPSCYIARLLLLSEDSQISYTFTNKGCSSKSNISIGQTTELKGKHDDLQYLAIELFEWNKIKIINEENQNMLMINNQEVFSSSFEENFGDLKAVHIEFSGRGSIDDFMIINPLSNDTILYNGF